ncbi:MAG: Gfo/Idh/MocA family oxidoreductase [Alicyclobacillus shizuokensis]|nr:Gfo/Idh/MocA family oxidoreductase [Alicyclobacillus shizuokensis]
MTVLQVGVIGCGNISAIYLKNLRKYEHLHVAACADLDLSRAKARAAEFGIDRACTVEELLADPAIDIVVNLTIPAAHADVARQALQAGKHVYGEKPLAISFADGLAVQAAAKSAERRVGSAPATFLGAAQQTCRHVVDAGAIGKPVAGTAFMLCHGHEHWHPDPAFYYQPGGGPLFDMGPYYITALINLLGPVRRVTGSARASFSERVIRSQPKAGEVIQVNTPTHLAAVLDFECGAIVTLVTSFDVWHANVPCIEIYGTEGTLTVPDPNNFGGTPQIRRAGEPQWQPVTLTHPYAENERGLGVADLAEAILQGRTHRANGGLALHVLEVMDAVIRASETGAHVILTTTCERPAPMPATVAAAADTPTA